MIETMIMSNYTFKDDLAKEVTDWINDESIDVISVSYVFEPNKMSGWHALITYRKNEKPEVRTKHGDKE